MNSTSVNKLILVAKIVATKGLKGEVKIKSFLETPDSILEYDLKDKNEKIYQVESFYEHKNLLIAKIIGYNSIEMVEPLINKELYIYREELPQITAEEDTYYHVDLVGLQVFNENNVNIGTVVSVYDFGAGDILEIETTKKTKFMLELTKKNFPVINIKEKFVQVTMPEEIIANENIDT